jgi:hypothetical protein
MDFPQRCCGSLLTLSTVCRQVEERGSILTMVHRGVCFQAISQVRVNAKAATLRSPEASSHSHKTFKTNFDILYNQ